MLDARRFLLRIFAMLVRAPANFCSSVPQIQHGWCSFKYFHPSSRSSCRSRPDIQSRRIVQQSFSPARARDARCSASSPEIHPDPSFPTPKRHVPYQSVIVLPKQASTSQPHLRSRRHATRSSCDFRAATPKCGLSSPPNGRFA